MELAVVCLLISITQIITTVLIVMKSDPNNKTWVAAKGCAMYGVPPMIIGFIFALKVLGNGAENQGEIQGALLMTLMGAGFFIFGVIIDLLRREGDLAPKD
jgi:uncharacterized membrane protein